MKTQIKISGDTILITMDGKLDFGTHVPLRDDLRKLLNEPQKDATPKKIIFDLSDLEFVGSSGISSFVQTLKEFNTQSPSRPRYCNVKSEFRKIIKAFDDAEAFEFFDSDVPSKKTIDQ